LNTSERKKIKPLIPPNNKNKPLSLRFKALHTHRLASRPDSGPIKETFFRKAKTRLKVILKRTEKIPNTMLTIKFKAKSSLMPCPKIRSLRSTSFQKIDE
jgi:hypothetical protein